MFYSLCVRVCVGGGGVGVGGGGEESGRWWVLTDKICYFLFAFLHMVFMLLLDLSLF